MADTTLNQFVGRGTAAEMAAFTPTPPSPANAPPEQGYIFFNTDDGIQYSWNGANWVAPTGTGTVTNTGTLTDHALIVGNGGVDVSALGSLGTTTTLLHGNAAGDPTFGAVVTADITNANVTLAKIANAAANDKLLGSGNSGSGASYAEISLGTGLSMSGTTLNASASSANPFIATGRLTTESGVPVSITERTAQSTIYYTPYLGAQIALYDGANWAVSSFTERSLALSGLTSGKNYDVFLFDNTGTLTLELSAAWSNDTTRTDAITLQDGIYVKSGATTRRYLGTIRTTGTTTTSDSGGGVTSQVGAQRFVWNYQNQVGRSIGVIDTTNTWSYTTQAWRQAGGASGNLVEWVQGLNGTAVDLRLMQLVNSWNNNTAACRTGIGYDTTSGASGVYGNVYNAVNTVIKFIAYSAYAAPGALGYHFGAWMEYGADGNCVFIGDDGGVAQCGMTGIFQC